MNEKHLLIFSDKWCGPCKMMKAYVWEHGDVKKALENFTSVNFIDIDDPKNIDMARIYRVNAVPTIYVVDDKGVPIKVGSTMDVNQTVNFLEK